MFIAPYLRHSLKMLAFHQTPEGGASGTTMTYG